MPPTLQLNEVGKHYGALAVLSNVSLSVTQGESVAIIGHNGAGKTTLMKIILGLTRPSSGTVLLANRLDTGSGNLGFLPEVVAFPGSITARRMLYFYAALKRRSKQEADELIELTGLDSAADRRIATFSKGMRQRLGLAQSLLGSPELLLLDEPTSGLDPFLRQHFYDIIARRQAAGAAILISSHALTELEPRTDRIAILKHGHLITSGSLEELRAAAGLATQIEVTLTAEPGTVMQSLMAQCTHRQINPRQLVFDCSPAQKLDLLRALANCDGVVDLEIRSPGLDSLYAHFAGGDSPL